MYTQSTAGRARRNVGGAAVGLLAELCLVAGGLIAAYLVWFMWWNDVVSVSAQTSLVDGLHQAATTDGGTPHREAAPTLERPADLAVFGTMQIPRFGADYVRPIGQGTDREKVLNTIGLGHYPDAAMPGQPGNFAVAGHRVTYGKPLNEIADLHENDPIVVRVTVPTQTPGQPDTDTWYVYRVTDSQIVTPEHVEVIAPVPNQPEATPGETDRWLTLTACHPMWSAKERFITHAKLDYWLPASEGTPAELHETTTGTAGASGTALGEEAT